VKLEGGGGLWGVDFLSFFYVYGFICDRKNWPHLMQQRWQSLTFFCVYGLFVTAKSGLI
jgi:hypothetical protein